MLEVVVGMLGEELVAAQYAVNEIQGLSEELGAYSPNFDSDGRP